MSWFVNLVVSLFTTILQGFSSLLLTAGITIQHVIADNMMSHGSVPFGSGSWFDVLPAGRNETVLQTFMGLFWVLATAGLAIAFYAMVARIASAHRSAVKRERVRAGVLDVVIAVLLLCTGEKLAVTITQVFYDLSLGVLHLGSTSVAHYSLPSIQGNGIVTFFNAVVEFVQVVMAVVLYVMYQFRALFLDAWVIFFPVAMACFAHEKTRGIAKWWWTEWIYQMAVPFGQALVFSFSYAMVDPHNKAALGIADIFTALTGVIGFIASSIYVRKLVTIVAHAFEAPLLGNTPGGMAAVAAGALAGDAVAGVGIAALGKAYGTVGKGAFRAIDRRFAPSAKAAITEAPETHAGMIREGATLDDLMSHHVLSAQGADPLQRGGGTGLEAASTGARMMGKASMGTGRTPSRSRLRVPMPMGLSSRALGAVEQISQGMNDTMQGSYMAQWAQTKWAGMHNEGGLVRRGIDQVAPTVGQLVQSRPGQALFAGAASVVGGVARAGITAGSLVASGDPMDSVARGRNAQQRTVSAVRRVGAAPMVYQANRAEQRQRMEEARGHFQELLVDNVAVQRMGNVNPYPYQGPDEAFPEGTFVGNTPAMDTYLQAEQGFLRALQEEPSTTNRSTEAAIASLGRMKEAWDREEHVPDLQTWPQPVQAAYQKAHTAYRPYRQDITARARIASGRVHLTAPHDEPRKQDLARVNAFLADARASILAHRR